MTEPLIKDILLEEGKMNVGILTHYDVNNLGAQLQMYATYNKLKELGHTPVILTYNKNFDFEYEQKLRNQISAKSIPYIFREFVLKKGIRQTWHNTKKYKINQKFRKEHFTFSFYASTDLDAVIIGADEVFSLQVGINMMMYGHGLLTKNCIAYAPSFGETTMEVLEKHNATALIGAGLSRFVALSARDDHTYKMEEELTGRKPVKVCDPVILYDFGRSYVSIKEIGSEYVGIYSYDRNMTDEKEIQAIIQFAKKRNLKTVSIGNFHKWCDFNLTCDCLEWLEYMRQAKYVITDTFHGAVVSTILHKEVAIMKRGINTNKLTALMQDTCMENRGVAALTEKELEKIFSQSTDFRQVDEALLKIRDGSNIYIKSALELCKG